MIKRINIIYLNLFFELFLIMENLSEEKLTNKTEKIKSNIKEDIQENNETNIENNNEKNNEEIEDNNREGEISTEFSEKIELTEEERNLRKNYLKKVTKKEAIKRSIILGRKAYYSKLYNFIINLIYNFISYKETKFKSDAINAITSKDLNKFVTSLKYHIISTIIYKILNFIDDRFFKYLTNDNTENIMLENFLFKKDIEFFDLYKTGELYNKVNTNTNFPYFNIIDTCSRIGEYIFKIIYFGYYLYKDFFEMSIIYIIIVIVQTIVEPFVFQDASEEQMFEKIELKENYINEVIANIRLIKSFGTEKKEFDRINNIEVKLRKKSIFKQILEEFYNNLYSANELTIFYTCGKKSITGEMNYGELLIFQEYSGEFRNSLNNIIDVFKSIHDGINNWIKFLQIYDIEQKIVSKKNIIPKAEENSDDNEQIIQGFEIIFNNVSFSYPTKKNTVIIDNFNLTIEPGKTIAIVGNSGSGKTTLTYLLLRFYDVDKGEILINGIDIKDLNLSWLRNNIGIVSQEPVLTSGTIRENVLYGVDNYTEKQFIEVCKLANVYSFATDKKIFPKEFDTIVGERGVKVSGGQKQRIAIARALMKDAKILIFDEATSALDSENEAIVQGAINNVINKKKITSIIIAHRLSTVKNADVIYVMNHGKIVEYGTHNELILKNGEYKKLIQRQLI